MKRILFNATHAEELRVAIVDGQKLLDLDLESAVRVQRKGNIYKATVTRVEPSLEACFVNYGSDRHGFLPFKEIYRGYFQNYSSKTPLSKLNIKDVIKEGQKLIIQVEKDERGNKGAALTTFISLAGRFLVLMPNNPKGGGISRRVEGKERSDLKRAIDALKIPKQHAMIARTAALGRTDEELKWDYEFLIQLWTAIEDAAANSKAPALIYQESNLLVRAIRDHLNSNVQELIIDDQEIFERASRFVSQVMPRNLSKLKMHTESTPLFSHFQIENQIESAFSREVRLRSGGAIVIDHTEALISIDVNSARATKGGDIEETALNTNLEAVEEIARQLRIRDLGGLLVLDLIDMSSSKNQRSVEARLKASLKQDRARVQIGRISRFGLLEMSRQRIRASIGDSNYHTCPRCEGTGHIRSIVSGSLSLLRIIEEEALKENTESLQVFLPINTAAYILNEKRRELAQLEARLATRVVVVPVRTMESPHYEIKRLRSNELDDNPSKPSHELSLEVDTLDEFSDITGRKPRPEKPVIGFDQMTPSTPPPTRQAPVQAGAAVAASTTAAIAGIDPEQPGQGLIKRLWKTFKGEAVGATADQTETTSGQAPAKEAEAETPKQQSSDNQTNPRRNRGRQQNRNRQNQSRQRTGGNRRRPNSKQENTRQQPRKQAQNKAQDNNSSENNQGNQQEAKPQQGAKQDNRQRNKPRNQPRNQPRNKQTNTRPDGDKPAKQTDTKANTRPESDKQAKQTDTKANTRPESDKPAKQTDTKANRPQEPMKKGSSDAPTSTPAEAKKPQRGRGRPRKSSTENAESNTRQAPARRKKKVSKKKQSAKETEGNATQRQTDSTDKKPAVRKKRVSKKKTSAKKSSGGNVKRTAQAAPSDVDGNK